MKLSTLLYKLINWGIAEGQTIEEATRLRIINQFNLLCISYSIPYIVFSLSIGFPQPAIVFLQECCFILPACTAIRTGITMWRNS